MNDSPDRRHILEHTVGLWEPLRDGRLFITGGTGFFGTWLLQSLLWANEEFGLRTQAVVLSRNWRAFCEKAPHLAVDRAVSHCDGDVRDFAFPSGSFSHIIHAATEASARLNDEDPLLMLDTIVAGTRRVLDFARHCGARRLLLASSGAIYGRQPPEVSHVAEDFSGGPDPASPRSAYGEGKRMAEHLAVLYARQFGLEPTIARGFAFVGPHLSLDIHYAVGNFIRDGLHGGPIVVHGDGTPYRSYLCAADMAVWLWNILLRGQPCRPYNVGSEEAISVGALAHAVADAFRPSPPVQILQLPAPGRPAERYVPSTARARNELGLRQTVGLAEAIRRTIEHHLSEDGTQATAL
jgi:nucleoside-diphosphate-sugar epimerase